MNAEKQAKHNQVAEITNKITNSKSLVIAEYSGLTVKELQELRKELKEHDVELKVYKNRLFKIAAKEAKLDLDESLLGPNIYAFGMEDEISAPKILAKFAKEHEALKLKAGTYEGKVIDSEELAVIATLPSYDEALTMLATSMLSPLKNISVGLNMLVTENKLESAPAEEAPKEEAKEAPTEEVKEEVTEEPKAETPEETPVEEVKEETVESPKEETPAAETKEEAPVEEPKEEAPEETPVEEPKEEAPVVETEEAPVEEPKEDTEEKA